MAPARLYVPITAHEFERLKELAWPDRRPPAQMAANLLARAIATYEQHRDQRLAIRSRSNFRPLPKGGRPSVSRPELLPAAARERAWSLLWRQLLQPAKERTAPILNPASIATTGRRDDRGGRGIRRIARPPALRADETRAGGLKG